MSESLAALMTKVKAALQQATRNPSVQELEKILQGGGVGSVEILPSGEIVSHASATLLARAPEWLGALVQAVEDQQRRIEELEQGRGE